MSSNLILLSEYFVIAVVMIFLPFIHIIYAIIDKKDIHPLPLNLNYSKDPRYMANKFKEYFFNKFKREDLTVGAWLEDEKFGKVFVATTENLDRGNYENIVYAPNSIKIPENMTIKYELLSEGNIDIYSNSKIRAVKSEQNILVKPNSTIQRWMDATGDIYVGQHCCVNIVSASSYVVLSYGTKFKRIYGNPIVTAETIHPTIREDSSRHKAFKYSEIQDNLMYLGEGENIINKDIEKSIISQSKLTVTKGISIHGDIKTNGSLFLSENCMVYGNVFAEGDINISKECFIAGNIFSHKNIYISEGTQVGVQNHSKSIIAKYKIYLEKRVIIFNYILTDGVGEIV